MKKLKRFIIKQGNQYLAKLAVSHNSKSIKSKLCNTHAEAESYLAELDKVYKEKKKLRAQVKNLFKSMTMKEIVEYIQNQKFEGNNRITQKNIMEQVFRSLFEEYKDYFVEMCADVLDMGIINAMSYVDEQLNVTTKTLMKQAENGHIDTVFSFLSERIDNALGIDTESEIEQENKGNTTLIGRELVEKIKKIPGRKIVTLSAGVYTQKFDIDEQGYVGYAPEHLNMLYELIDFALEENGGIIIRQFIPNSEELQVINGKQVKMPYKALYGIFIKEGEIYALPAEEVEISCSYDYNTNQKLEPEPMVIYRDITEFIK